MTDDTTTEGDPAVEVNDPDENGARIAAIEFGDLAQDEAGQWKAMAILQSNGALTPVSLVLTDPYMEYDRYEALLRCFGQIERSSRWWIGDLINFGEAIFGEEAAQAIEATQAERYDLAQRITGLDIGTLQNVRSICGRIAPERRRVELPFWTHAEVAALEPDDQTMWLQRTIENGWTKNELREAIRAAQSPPVEPDEEPDPGQAGEPGLSVCDRIEQAARVVYGQGQPTSDGGALVPAEAWSQLAASLGEE